MVMLAKEALAFFTYYVCQLSLSSGLTSRIRSLKHFGFFSKRLRSRAMKEGVDNAGLVLAKMLIVYKGHA